MKNLRIFKIPAFQMLEGVDHLEFYFGGTFGTLRILLDYISYIKDGELMTRTRLV